MHQILQRRRCHCIEAPSPKRISNELLLAVYVEYKGRVQALIEAADYINIVFDALENIWGERILNLCVALPHGRAYYWKTFDVQEVELAAQGHYSFLLPILRELTGGK
jgi:hypothetical protein